MTLQVRLAIEWFAIGLVATLLALAAYWSGGTSSFDELFYDTFESVSAPPADDNVLIIAIDDKSISALGRWPWDRAIHAKLVKSLQQAKPRTITLDLLLSEPTNSDDLLANAITSGSAPVLVPMHFSAPGDGRLGYDPARPVEVLRQKAKSVGHANILFDPDGIVRKTNLCFRDGSNANRWPHISEYIYRGAGGGPSPAFAADTSCGQELRIPFSERGSFSEISYIDVLEGNLPSDFVRGKDVIIGSVAPGMGDSYPTPNGEMGLLPGSEIMANVVGALRRNDFITSPPKLLVAALSLLPLWILLIGFLRWPPRLALSISVMSLFAILGTTLLLLSYRIWLPPGTALIGVIIAYPLWGWRRLQAMSDFLTVRLQHLEADYKSSAVETVFKPALDVVGRQSEALAGAIDQLGDLRRHQQNTLSGLPDPMFVTDIEGRITLGNQLFEAGLGLKHKPSTITDVIDQIVDPKQRLLVDAYLEKKSMTGSEFVRFRSTDERSFVMRTSAITNEHDVVQGYIFYLTDITSLALAEARREEVLQLLSHDMRAPQSTIIALLGGDMNADVKQRIERNARQTMQLAQDFIEIARMGEVEFKGDDILLADFVREAADGLWPLAHERGIKFLFHDESGGAFVSGEPASLLRAVCNIIDNAIKYGPDHSEIHFRVKRFWLNDASHISVEITDQGPGIAPHILPHLFGRFMSDADHKGRVKGTGLGLAFVQAVMERHGGRVSGKNNERGGASFTLALPEAEATDEVL